MRAFEKVAGENFSSWEHRIDHQLAFANSRIDIIKYTLIRNHSEKIGTLQGRCDRAERRVRTLELQVSKLVVAVWLLLALVILSMGSMAALLTWST